MRNSLLENLYPHKMDDELDDEFIDTLIDFEENVIEDIP